MAIFAEDAFTSGSDQTLQAYSALWNRHTSFATDATVLTATGNVRGGSDAATSVYYRSETPQSADYDVQADCSTTQAGNSRSGVVGRCDTAAQTFYYLYLDSSTGQLTMAKAVAGVFTGIGTPYAIPSYAHNTPYTIRLNMTGTSLTGYLNGVSRITATDSSISAAGKAGIILRLYDRIDNWSAYDGTGALFRRRRGRTPIGLEGVRVY